MRSSMSGQASQAMSTRFRWQLVVAAFAPFTVASAYLLFSRRAAHPPSARGDYAAFAVSIFIGALFIVTLPIRRSLRVNSLLLYVPVMIGLLIYFSLSFIAVAFHDGL